MKGNIRTAITLLKNGKDFGQLAQPDELVNVDNLNTVIKILRLEGVTNVNIEHAMRSLQQKNIQSAINFIWGPSPHGDGRGLIRELEELAKMRNE